MTRPHEGMAEGIARRDAALSLLEASRATIILAARRALVSAALENGTATADDVHDRLGPLPADVDGRCLGSIGLGLAKAGILVDVDFVRSRRPERHASRLTVWALRDRDEAIEWLRDNPLPADPKPIEPKPIEPPAGRTGLSLFDFLQDTKGSEEPNYD